MSANRERWLLAGFSIYLVSSLISMATMSVGAVLLAVILLAAIGPRELKRALSAELRRPASRAYLGISLALASACVASLIAARLDPLGYGGQRIAVKFGSELGKLWYLLWPLPLAAGLRLLSEGARARAIRAWLVAFLALSIVGVIQHFTGWPRWQPIPGTARFHATLFLGHHLSVASIWIFPFFAALEYARDRAKADGLGLRRGLIQAACAAGFATLLLTSSRMLWLALPVGLLAWSLWNLPRRWAAGAAVAIGLAVAGASQHPAIQSRFQDGFGFTTRQELWQANLLFFKERPWFGVGWRHNHELSGWYLTSTKPAGSYIFQGHAHNNFLDVLSGMGLFGIGSWLAWSFFAFAALWPAARRSVGFARGLVCAWLVFQLNGLTQVNFWEGKVMHQMMLMMAFALFWAGTEARRAEGA